MYSLLLLLFLRDKSEILSKAKQRILEQQSKCTPLNLPVLSLLTQPICQLNRIYDSCFLPKYYGSIDKFFFKDFMVKSMHPLFLIHSEVAPCEVYSNRQVDLL